MKRALIATLISGALALSSAVPLTALGMESMPPVPVPIPDVSDSVPCSAGDTSLVAASGGCCQRQGGICGCRNGKARCCDGTPGVGCSCRGDSTPSEEL